MLASTRGPSIKPALRATNKSDPSLIIVINTKAVAEPIAVQADVVDDLDRQQLIHGFAAVGAGVDAQQQVGNHQSAGRDGQREGHVAHGAFGGLDARLAHHRHAIGNRLDAGIGAAAHRIGIQKQPQHAENADRRIMGVLAHLGRNLGGDAADVAQVQSNRAADDEDMRQQEDQEDRQQKCDRFLDAAHVQHDEQKDRRALDNHHRLVVRETKGAEIAACQTKQRVAGRRDRGGDGQHIIDQQRAARYDADSAAKQLRGHQIAAAAAGKFFDDMAIARRDDEDRQNRGQRQEDGQIMMGHAVLDEVLEGFGRAVARRRQPVGPQTRPRPK